MLGAPFLLVAMKKKPSTIKTAAVNSEQCCVQNHENHIHLQNYIFCICKTICFVHGIYFCICKNKYFCKTYIFTYAKLYVLLNLWKTTYFELKKKNDSHFMMRHVPLKQPVIMVILFCLLRMTTCIVYYFEVSDLCRKGGIRIQNNFSTKFTLYTLTISHWRIRLLR